MKGPWKLENLYCPPRAEWIDTSGELRRLFYDNEPYCGRLTKIFAYLALPEELPAPGMVLVHGGGGKAFPQWVRLWAERGYVAIAMDLGGCGEDGERLPDGGPPQDDKAKFHSIDQPVIEHWVYHSIAAVVRSVSLLRSLPFVDSDRIGITGISWGGYLTCIVAGLDNRIKVAIPVYGCGFLHENSVWIDILNAMSPEHRGQWIRWYEPSQYLPQCRIPTLWVNGTNDLAYPLDSYQKSYRLVKGERVQCVKVGMAHGHEPGWSQVEIGIFADECLRGGTPLPRIKTVEREGDILKAAISSDTQVVSAHLNYTVDSGAWQQREWQMLPAELENSTLSATIPRQNFLSYFLTITDERGATVSSDISSNII